MTGTYNVLENVAATLDRFNEADYVLAFCGECMYVVKSGGTGYKDETPPCKPDYVLGYFRLPEPHTERILLQDKTEERHWISDDELLPDHLRNQPISKESYEFFVWLNNGNLKNCRVIGRA